MLVHLKQAGHANHGFRGSRGIRRAARISLAKRTTTCAAHGDDSHSLTHHSMKGVPDRNGRARPTLTASHKVNAASGEKPRPNLDRRAGKNKKTGTGGGPLDRGRQRICTDRRLSQPTRLKINQLTGGERKGTAGPPSSCEKPPRADVRLAPGGKGRTKQEKPLFGVETANI